MKQFPYIITNNKKQYIAAIKHFISLGYGIEKLNDECDGNYIWEYGDHCEIVFVEEDGTINACSKGNYRDILNNPLYFDEIISINGTDEK